MSEEKPVATPEPSPDRLPEPVVERRRNWLPSLIWLIPIVAALVGVFLIARILREQGPEIEITFLTAEGLEAGKTAVKYKEVEIGTVQSIRLTRDRLAVRVRVQLRKDAEGFTAADTRFWVVRPRLGSSGISGLGTLLSGAYIGADAGESEETSSEFKGLEQPPIIVKGTTGRQFVLHAKDAGSVDIGTPVYFRRIEVGQVASYTLDEDGRGVTIRVFVNTPYDRFVGVNTRFWHASGVDVQLNASGLSLRTQALATVLLGGIAFRAPEDDPGPVAVENTEFVLASDENTAMRQPDGPARNVLMYFNQSLRGLVPGAPIDFRGIVIGEVKSIGVEFDREKRQFRMPVYAEIYPDRLRRHSKDDDQDDKWGPDQRVQFLVNRGLRAQLRVGNLLTGQIYVALDFFPKAAKVDFDATHSTMELPTIPNSLDDIQAQVQEIVTKLNKVPYEEIGNDARKALASLNRTLVEVEGLGRTLNKDVSPELLAAMKDVRRTLDTAQRTLREDSPLQQDMRQTLQELTRAASSLRVLTDYLEQHPESLLRGKPEDLKK
ncbi:MlaD family protein [Variovorax dokdonensis]|uniref:MlaD family protein n=1 Tax=Variovorax dokdonensis TaxID=344883 RepID=A0ABT7NGX4_9BURK|nr:MlaD family protein [Variovorax dokdonensis]MDM0047167.1 MlaD family protein [Variovorax dokdonensis]